MKDNKPILQLFVLSEDRWGGGKQGEYKIEIGVSRYDLDQSCVRMDLTSFEVRSTKDRRPTVQIWLTSLIPLISFSCQRQDPSSSSSSSFFYVPQLYLWCSPLSGEIFAYVTSFNPTIEVITFRLRGWCMLGVLFVAGTHPSRT